MLLTLILSWLAVTTDCHGGPESVVTYRVERFDARVVDWVIDPESGNLMPIYLKTFETEPLMLPLWQVPEPEVGEVIGWDGYPDQMPLVVAIDESGNRSDSPCQ